MDARKQPILVETKTFILKEALVDSDGESIWFITDSQNKNISFCVHCQFSGSIYISFFKGLHYNNDFVIEALKELLKILLEKYHIITINIYYKNKSLITLCKKIGFQKQHNVRHLYYLRSLK